MYDFSIGIMLDSLRMPIPQALKAAADMNVHGIQLYATSGEMAPENMSAAKRRQFLHMVKDAIAAYVQVDLSTAAQVIARDDDCDAMFSRISKEIAAYIAAHPSDAETALDLFMIDKYLERLGDHAVNIAEWVEFLKTGVHKSRKIV